MNKRERERERVMDECIIKTNKNRVVLEMQRRLKNKREENRQLEMQEWWGDRTEINDEWPTIEREGRIRIYGQNLNGVSLEHDIIEWETV